MRSRSSTSTHRLAAAGALCLAIALPVAAGSAPPRAAATVARTSIIGGRTPVFHRWRFMVALFNRRIGFWCGGSVLNATTVLTAAHCVEGVRVSNLFVVAKRPRLTDTRTGERIEVSAKRVDPRFSNGNLRHDFALLTLESPTTAPAIVPASVREDELATVPGAKLRVAGWGTTDPDRLKLPGVLKRTVMRVRDNRACRRAFPAIFSPRTNICLTGEPIPHRRLRSGDCDGDSGGPLVAKTADGLRQVGVVSYGGPRCGVGPTAPARVADDLEFIEGP